jgi:UDP-2,3-diacylglucosamine pyrophosphatase LpxH
MIRDNGIAWPTNQFDSAIRSPSTPPQTFDAVVLSDIHLGSANCQASALARFLEGFLDGQMRTRLLIINGDVFDSIDFRRLKKRHWKVLSLVRHLSDKIEVIWIAGNHDGPAEIVSNLLGVRVAAHHVLVSGSRRVLILHGHQSDKFVQDHPVLTWLADCLYAALQKLDRTHCVARLAKRQSKVFLRCEGKVRDGAIALARQSGCDTVICGHTHHPVASPEGPIRYYNSGCWTEKPCHYLTLHDGAVDLCRFEVSSDEEPADEALTGEGLAMVSHPPGVCV